MLSSSSLLGSPGAHNTRRDLLTLTQQAVQCATPNSMKGHIHSWCFHRLSTKYFCGQTFAAGFLLLLSPWKDNSTCLESCYSVADAYGISCLLLPERGLLPVVLPVNSDRGKRLQPCSPQGSGMSGWAAACRWSHVWILFSHSLGVPYEQESRDAGTHSRLGPR